MWLHKVRLVPVCVPHVQNVLSWRQVAVADEVQVQVAVQEVAMRMHQVQIQPMHVQLL